MKNLAEHVGECISLHLSGQKYLTGIVIDIGNDIVVIYDGKDFVYLSSFHIQDYQFTQPDYFNDIKEPEESAVFDQISNLSLRKVMDTAKGMFTEIYVAGNQSLHGYITGVMNDYFTFYSPIYKTIFITIKHIKWIKPYQPTETPYGLEKEKLPFVPPEIALSRTFAELLKKSINQLVVFDLGEHPHRIGKVEQLDNDLLELTLGRKEKTFVNMHHIKILSFP